MDRQMNHLKHFLEGLRWDRVDSKCVLSGIFVKSVQYSIYYIKNRIRYIGARIDRDGTRLGRLLNVIGEAASIFQQL